MSIFRVLPPAASPSTAADIFSGLLGMLNPEEYLARFHRQLSAQFSVKHAVSFSSGKAALTVALRALREQYPDRDRVIIPAFNCWSVPSAIVKAGCIMLPCDIDANTLDFNIDALRETLKHSEKILAVCPTYLFGLPPATKKISELVNNPAITIIHDAAQAMGTLLFEIVHFKPNDIVIFSLGRGKAFSAGEGGVLLTGNETVAANINRILSTIPAYSAIQILKLCVMNLILMLLINPRLYTFPSMLPFLKLGDTLYEPHFPLQRLSGFQAGWSAAWRQRLDKFNVARSRCVEYYTTELCNTPGITLFTDKKSRLPCIRFPVLFASEKAAEQVLAFGKRNGLGIAITYPDTVDSLGEVPTVTGGPYLQAKKVTQMLLTLPSHPLVRVHDMEKIVAGVKKIVRECSAHTNG